MAAKKTTDSPSAPQTPEGLAERLIRHAGAIRNPAANHSLGDDLREAARLLEEWRAGIHEAIATTADDTTRGRLQKLVKDS